MDKIYRLLEWLDIEQSVDWLQDLTKTPLTARELLALCDSGRCAVYIKLQGLVGYEAGAEVIGEGVHRVLNPLALRLAGSGASVDLTLEGSVCLAEDVGDGELFFAVWIAKTPLWQYEALFQSTDIQALANKMNAAGVEVGTVDCEALAEQLQEERAARFAAERRAEQAEAALSKLRLANKSADGQTGIGTSFPYSTKSLKAAAAACAEYWKDFDPHRPPLQKQVSAFIVEQGIPARQAEELARAIRPDCLADTEL